MSNTSAPLSLAVCIRRSWASFPLPRLSCRNFTFHPQPPELFLKYWVRTAPRSMGDIFSAPISTSQAPRGSLALLGHERRAPTPSACILLARKFAATRHMAISLAPNARGYLDMLADSTVYPPYPQLTKPEQAPSIRLG